jgi:two-component system LytT family sensor kinase
MALKIFGRTMRVFLHIAAWIILVGLPLYNLSRWNVPAEFIWIYCLLALVNAIIFYANYLVLIPKLFFRNKRSKYYISSFILVATLFTISMFSLDAIDGTFEKIRRNNDTGNRDRLERRDFSPPSRPPKRRNMLTIPFGPVSIYSFAFNALVFTVFAFGLKMIEHNSEIEKKQKELEKEKLNSELAFLKNQISPHFFFNTLNNIYSLIEINKEDSQNAILKLSKMMRYLLYESEQGETRLSNEIEFMNNYIDLMRLRLSDKVKLNIEFPDEYDNLAIPPLLFISVIENAFKHGISYREKSFITIDMQIDGNNVNFLCENSVVTQNEKEKNGGSGIGMENLKKRLGLLFPDKHELKIIRSPDIFHVAIKIELNKS